MPKFINVRGCNGSGKTTLLRHLAKDPICTVGHLKVTHMIKDKKTGEKVRKYHPDIPVTYCPGGIAILGDYTPAAAGSTTAGCDRIKTQEATKAALELIAQDTELKAILFEGIVVSTIHGPWQDWSQRNGGMCWAFIDTPLEICLDRIQKRNGGKPVKEDQIADKHRTIARVRDKATQAGEEILDINWLSTFSDLEAYLGTL